MRRRTLRPHQRVGGFSQGRSGTVSIRMSSALYMNAAHISTFADLSLLVGPYPDDQRWERLLSVKGTHLQQMFFCRMARCSSFQAAPVRAGAADGTFRSDARQAPLRRRDQ
ncbi:hypothetical protein GCM10010439_59350 [Actinocorallia aurantiaca]|uniref:Uncharacterized protein n=1 Tax=Actinocorallia aurantiaca TaxID=46204 RepID=A0ABN3UMQ3_9ACTN